MRQFFSELRDFFRRGDMLLLFLCVGTSAFGCLMIASTTNYLGYVRYVSVQIGAILLGVVFYAIVSSIDIRVVAERWGWLVLFNIGMLLLLRTPFGMEINGNRSWVRFPFMPVNIQPAEFCKISFVIIMAAIMARYQDQDKVSSLRCVGPMLIQLLLTAGLNYVVSGDAGVSLIFAFVFVIMAYAGGVKWPWFVVGGVSLGAALPFVWKYGLKEYQRLRIKVLYDATIDPLGMNECYQLLRSLRSLTSGGPTGQGLFNGTRTQSGALVAQHTDFIFSAIGEELGYLGCVIVIIMLLLIVIRCLQVGTRSPDLLRCSRCIDLPDHQ